MNRTYAYFYDFQGKNFIGNPKYSSSHLFSKNDKLDTKNLVILGDSLMAGTGTSQEENSIGYLIAQNLSEDKNIELHNLALPGVGVEDVLKRQIPEAIRLKPDYIVLMIGINDIHNKKLASWFKSEFSEILETLKSETNAKITVINIPHLGSDKILLPPWNKLLIYRQDQFNNIIASDTSEKGINIIDINEKFAEQFRKSSDLYSEDQFHPSDKGYLLWSEYINEHITD